MEDQAETREQFLREVEKLRRQVANLQAKDPEPDNAGEPRLSLEDAQRFFDALPDIILMVDAQGDILRANRTSMEALGYKEENVLGKSMELFFPPERREEAWLALAETVSDKPTVADISLLKKNGRLISTETKVIKSFWDGRDVFFGICRDISSRRLAEKILRNQRDLGLALTSARSLDETTRLCAEYSVRMPNIDAWGIFLLDEASGDMILDNPLGFSSGFVNSESRQAAGSDFTRLAMAGREVYAACKQTDVPLCGIFHNEGFTSMGVLPFKPEGRVIACAVFASRTLTGFTDEIRGRINAIAPQIGLAISWAKGLEKMRISEYAMESSINAMVMTDLDWVITYVNRALLDLMQMEKEDMLGKHFFDLWVSPAAFDEYLEIFTKTGNWRGELDAKKKDGSTFSVQMSGFVIKDEAGKPVRFMGSFVDITEYKTAEKALRESEQKYRILVETVTDTVFVIDTDGKLTYLNSAFEKGTGFSIQEKLGCHFTDLLSPEYVEKAISDFRRGLLGEKVPNYEVEILRRDGGVVSAEISVTSMLDPEGNPMCRIGVARDITDRKRAEEALKESQYYFQSLIEKSTDAIVILDQEGTFKFLSPSVKGLLGYNPEELMDKPAFEDIHPDDISRILTVFAQNIDSQGVTVTGDYRYRHKDGSWRFFESSGTNLLNDPVVHGVIINSRDVTERRQAESLVRSERDKFQGMLAALGDGVYIINRDFTVEYQNIALNEQFGDMTGRKCFTASWRLDAPCDFCRMGEAMESGKIINAECHTSDGGVYEQTWSPFTDVDGKVKVIVLRRDITERKAFQAEAMRISHLASLGELAAGVAHEINNPVNSIINYAQILSDVTGGEGEEAEVPQRIAKEGWRVAEIVRNLLAFARDRKEEHSPALLKDIMADSLGLLEKQLQKDGINLKVDIPSGLPKIKVRSQQIQQVFINLMSNARYALNKKYPGPHTGKILDIRAGVVRVEGRNHVRTTFHDHGTGIPPGLIQRICDPFFSTKPKGEGTGLGLSISHGIVEAHNGRLWFDSVEGEYTKVMVDLPLDNGWTMEDNR